ncbi:MAG: DUF6270 domain-containing protein [Xanthobacter sp.]
MKRMALLGSVFLKEISAGINSTVLRSTIYAPKHSAAAFMTDLYSIDPGQIEKNIPLFTRNIIQRDLHKTLMQEIRSDRPDVIIVDFLDDMAPLFVSPNDETVVTGSNYVQMSSLLVQAFASWKKIERNSEQAWDLWRAGWIRLRNLLKENTDQPTQIILIDIKQPLRFMEGGVFRQYGDAQVASIRKTNAIIARSIEMFREIMDCQTVTVPEDEVWSTNSAAGYFNPQQLNPGARHFAARELTRLLGLEAGLKLSEQERFERFAHSFGDLIRDEDPPTISELHAIGLMFRDAGDMGRARMAERMIMLLRNSSVPLSVKMGRVSFGYGGIGVVVHSACQLGNNVKVGTNVTLGGGRATIKDGVKRQVPEIEDNVYIATGAKIIGGVTIGHHSVIGANAVVTRDVPPFSVVAGNPGQILNRITPENVVRYASYFYRGLARDEVVALMFPEYI